MPSDAPLEPVVELSLAEAETILAGWLGRSVRCTGLRRLTGGCCYTVLELSFDAPQSPVVVKVADGVGREGIAREFEVLQHHRRHTTFPVPEPLHCDISGAALPYSWLIMERVPGANMAEVALSEAGRTRVERAMGEAVADLHRHTRDTYGRIGDTDSHADWVECFDDLIRDMHEENERLRLLPDETLAKAGRIVDALPRLLDAPCAPTLVHGDIWATNVMIDRGRLAAFLDPSGFFAHREYELAYVELWGTAGKAFLDAYHSVHSRLLGYERRRQVYWLHTLLLHVWLFKAEGYIRRTTDLVSGFDLG